MIYGNCFIGLLVNDAGAGCRVSAIEIGNTACAVAARIFIIFSIACISRLIRPRRAVSEPHVHRTAVIHNAVKPGIGCGKGRIDSPCGKDENIAVKIDICRPRRISSDAGIHINRALISAERIVAVIHAGRHRYLPAADRHFASCRIDSDPVAVDIKVYISVDLYFTVIYRCQDARVIETGIHIFIIYGNAPDRIISALDIHIAVDDDLGRSGRLIAGFAPAVRLLDSNAVPAQTACHGDIHRRMDGNPSGAGFRCVKPDGIGYGIAARKPGSNNIDLSRGNGDILSASRIDSRRASDGMGGLELQGMGAGMDNHIIFLMGIYGGKDIRHPVSRLIMSICYHRLDDRVFIKGII